MKIFIFTFTLLSFAIYPYNKDIIVAPVKYEGKYGFITTTGEWYIKPIFDSVGIFHNGYADFYKDGKNGIINSKGEVIIDSKFSFIGPFENGWALCINGNNTINYINTKGNYISKVNFFDGEDFSEGLATVKTTEQGGWTYINTNGIFITDSLFDYTNDFKDGKAEVTIGDTDYKINRVGKITDTINTTNLTKRLYEIIGVSNHSTLGMVNSKKDTIMPMKYKAFGYRQNNIFWFNQNNKYGLADTSGKIIIEAKYDLLSNFSDNGLAVAKKDGKYGYINKTGKTIIEFQFEKADGFKYGLAAVKLNGKWGFINNKGEFVIKNKFENISYHFKNISSSYEVMYSFDKED